MNITDILDEMGGIKALARELNVSAGPTAGGGLGGLLGSIFG